MKQSQKDKVIHRLNTYGEVDNFWAIGINILRLGAIMCDLKKVGWKFVPEYGKKLGRTRENWKNFYYIITSRPTRNLFEPIIDEERGIITGFTKSKIEI